MTAYINTVIQPSPHPLRIAAAPSLLRRSFAPRCLRLCLLLVVMPGTLRAQQRPHVISGRVTTDSGAVIPAANVFVTIAPTTETIGGTTDSTGAYRIVIPNPTGEYLLYS